MNQPTFLSDDFLIPEARQMENINENVFPQYQGQEFHDRDFQINTNLIQLFPDDVVGLLNLFEPTLENLTTSIKYIFRSPFVSNVLYDIVKNWYLSNQDNSEQDLQAIGSQENHPEVSNHWIFPILNALSESQRNVIWEKYFNNTINQFVQIDFGEDCSINSFRYKNYERKYSSTGIRVGDFFTDFKKVCCYIQLDNIFIIKQSNTLEMLNPTQFAPILKNIKLGCSKVGKNTKKAITAFDVVSFGKNLDFITYESMKFYSEDPNIFSYFHWYPYSRLILCTQNVIQPYLDHIFRVIANSDQELYDYIIKWISFIFQHPDGKTGTALVIIGEQGCGKNTFTNVLCQLLGEYSDPNANFDNITSNFNLQILNKKLLVCSEKEDINKNDRKYLKQHERLKTLITERFAPIEGKHRNPESKENVANFIFLTNNPAPIRIDEDDRRFVVTNCYPMKGQDYFQPLRNLIKTQDFKNNLITFFLTVDLSNFYPAQFPTTEARMNLMNFSKSPEKLFIEENLQKFRNGYVAFEAWTEFKKWAKAKNFRSITYQEFHQKILQDCSFNNNDKKYRLR